MGIGSLKDSVRGLGFQGPKDPIVPKQWDRRPKQAALLPRLGIPKA